MEHGTLGLARRTAGVDHVGQAVGGTQVYGGCVLAEVGFGYELAVDDYFSLTVTEHVLLPVLRVFQVDGHVGGSGLMDGDDGQREVDGAVEHDGYEVVGLHTALYEPMRQDVGTARQLMVCQAARGIGHGQTVGILAGILLESLHEGHLWVDVHLFAGTQFHECSALLIGSQLYVTK